MNGRFIGMMCLIISALALGFSAQSCAGVQMPSIEKVLMVLVIPDLGECAVGGGRSIVGTRHAVGAYALACVELLDSGQVITASVDAGVEQ